MSHSWKSIKAFKKGGKLGALQFTNQLFGTTCKRKKFALIQSMLLSHLVGMEGVLWDVNSLNMMKLLKRLIQFNFYNSIEELKEIIVPILKAIDRRSLETEIAAVSKNKDIIWVAVMRSQVNYSRGLCMILFLFLI